MIVRLLSYFFALIFASALGADEYESDVLFRKGGWYVEITHDTVDGEFWCAAETENRGSQIFSITTFQDNSIALFIFDPRWDISKRRLSFLVDVDYSRWEMDGHGDEIGVSIFMRDPQKAQVFLKELMEGNAVAVMNSDERRLATFTLSGSYAAMLKLFECWQRISSGAQSETDPFLSKKDPFN